jgi:hypothetical protein
VFPFVTLNPNAGKHLQKDILLFPTHTSSTHGDAHIDDYMSLPVVPNVTNVPASDMSHTATQVDAQQNTSDTSVEKNTTNDDTEPSGGSKTDVSSADSEEDHDAANSTVESAGPDPEVDSAGSPATSPEPPRSLRTWGPSQQARSVSPMQTLTRSTSPNASPSPSPSPEHEDNVVHTPSPPPPPPLVVARTRQQHGIKKPKTYTDGTIRYGLFTSIGEPSTLAEALDDVHWNEAMKMMNTGLDG